MKLRRATLDDLDRIAQTEAICFPEAEAATRESLRDRLTRYPHHFLLLEDGETLVGFINGPGVGSGHLSDDMYENAAVHDEAGSWQMIFGLDVIPSRRNRGCAALLLRRMIDDAREQGRRGLVLTCKESLVPYYAGFGFRDEGISESVHGGAVWHEMRLTFPA